MTVSTVQLMTVSTVLPKTKENTESTYKTKTEYHSPLNSLKAENGRSWYLLWLQ